MVPAEGMHKIAQINVGEPVWEKSSLLQGHWQYEITSLFTGTNNMYQVKRRYTEIELLQRLLKVYSPASVVPPVPQKTVWVTQGCAEAIR